MAESKKGSGSKRQAPGKTIGSRENQLTALAYDLAEIHLRDGSASSQVLTHFLRLGSVRAQIELEKLKKENELIEAKTKALESAQRMEALFQDAMKAFRSYSGGASEDED